jgi:hypothetical protein
MYTYIYIRVGGACVHIYTCVYMAYMYIRVYIRHTCVCVCVCVCVYIPYVHTHTPYIHTHIYIYHIYIYIYIYIYSWDARTHALHKERQSEGGRESVLFIGNRFSNLYTAVDTPAEAA